jgi:hypothetical protein
MYLYIFLYRHTLSNSWSKVWQSYHACVGMRKVVAMSVSLTGWVLPSSGIFSNWSLPLHTLHTSAFQYTCCETEVRWDMSILNRGCAYVLAKVRSSTSHSSVPLWGWPWDPEISLVSYAYSSLESRLIAKHDQHDRVRSFGNMPSCKLPTCDWMLRKLYSEYKRERNTKDVHRRPESGLFSPWIGELPAGRLHYHRCSEKHSIQA